MGIARIQAHRQSHAHTFKRFLQFVGALLSINFHKSGLLWNMVDTVTLLSPSRPGILAVLHKILELKLHLLDRVALRNV